MVCIIILDSVKVLNPLPIKMLLGLDVQDEGAEQERELSPTLTLF